MTSHMKVLSSRVLKSILIPARRSLCTPRYNACGDDKLCSRGTHPRGSAGRCDRLQRAAHFDGRSSVRIAGGEAAFSIVGPVPGFGRRLAGSASSWKGKRAQPRSPGWSAREQRVPAQVPRPSPHPVTRSVEKIVLEPLAVAEPAPDIERRGAVTADRAIRQGRHAL